MPVPAALVFAGKSVATPTISFLINKAFNYINEYFTSEGMDVVRDRLLQAMPRIQAVFDVVNPERVREQSSALDAWLWQLRDAVEAAEDAIDELEYYELEEKAKDRKVSEWGSPFGKMKHKFVKYVKSAPVLNKTLKKIAHGDTVKRLMKSVDDLDKAAKGVENFLHLIDRLSGGSTSCQQQLQNLVDSDRQTGSTLSATIFVGRVKEQEQIIGWLANTSDDLAETRVTKTNDIPIISVVGHGGMGKTTLAQSICEQDEVRNHFKVIWITVSTSFDATSLTSKILECITGAKPKADQLEPLQQDLKEKLRSIKFLLVLDDVWEDKKRDEWEKLFAPLKKLNTVGSKILLTTRMQSVAHMAAKVMGVKGDQCLTLQGLEEDENLELFKHHAFSGLIAEHDAYLQLIGKQIAKKLRGCPLVTKVVGEHLQDNITTEYWRRFLHQGLEHFKGTKEDIMKVLRLSYYHLPTELQVCFRYCCIFPQDYKFQKKELVQLWMGSGLISQPASGTRTLEDTAEQVLDQLTRKSFFDRKPGGASQLEQECYVMHDLMHELARNVSTGECAIIDDPIQLKDEKDTLRHLCIVNIESFSADEVKVFSHFKNLRTIIIYDHCGVEKDIISALGMVVQSSKSLRLFHSNMWSTSRFADKFGNLKHLRYFYLPYVSSSDTICAVTKLYHLMVLRSKGCEGAHLQTDTYELRYLGNLERLRYVSYGLTAFGNFPVSRLTSLQELHDYQVGGILCNEISAIGSLRELRELDVQCLENVENCEEAKNAKLKEKQYLNSLFLSWSTHDQIMTNDLVLDHLEPHANIGVLQIKGYQGLKIPFWIENYSVKNLVSLKLTSCINWEFLPSLGELVLLKRLVLKDLLKLRQIGRSSDMSSSSSMEVLLPQSLDTLEVIKCPQLRELPILPPSLVSLIIQDVSLTKLPMIGKISTENIKSESSKLTEITIRDCPCLTSFEGSLLEQKLNVEALCVQNVDDCMHMESTSVSFEEFKELPLVGPLQLLANLSSLEVWDCSSLVSLPSADVFKSLRSLQHMDILGCENLSSLGGLGSLPSPSNLSGLRLYGCSSLVSLPSANVFKCIRSLQYMDIEGCENLSSFGGLGSLSSIGELSINRCSKLTEGVGSSLTRVASGSAPGGEEEHLLESGSSLQIRSLYIDLPSLLLLGPLKSLCHTEYLIIDMWYGSEMESLPERWLLQNRTSLQSLYICSACSLKSLPPIMQDLCSLEKLDLFHAEQLQSLPYLPSSLKRLIISGCHPDLKEKITEHGSPEWNKIAHIPDARIGDWYFLMGKKFSTEAYDKLSDSDRNRLLSESSLH